jgi:CBS domain-containing protein
MKVSDILRSKGGDVVTVGPETSVRDLVALLRQHNIGAVVVTQDDRVTGIVSERDVVRGLADSTADSSEVLDRRVADIMTSDVATVAEDADAPDLARVMTDRRIRHLPVVTDGRLVGIVSIGDMVKSRIDELQFERDQLESYVSNAQS